MKQPSSDEVSIHMPSKTGSDYIRQAISSLCRLCRVKLSEGFSKPMYSVITVVGMIVSFLLLIGIIGLKISSPT